MIFNYKPLFTLFFLFAINFGFTQNQDINLTGNGNDIFNGGTNSPSLTNDTDFGDVEIFSSSQITFTIENTKTGGNPRNNKLTVSDISISGTNASDFVVSGISFPAVINRNNSTTFMITFSATLLGNETASVSITSDDPDENPYTFNLQGNGTEAGNDPSLTLTNTYPLSVLEPSGLAFDKTNNQLFTVSDNSNLIYRLSLTGTILQTYGYNGNDLEGISMYTSNKLLVAEEGNRELVEYDYVIDNGTFTAHTMNTNSPIDGGAANDGIEGVTYDSVNDKFYFLIEKNNGGLYEANGSFSITNQYEDPLAHGGDYSGSYYVEETGFLWLASDQTSTIYKCNTDGTIVNTFPVTTSGGGAINKLEGIAIDHANQLLYAVSDTGQELYVFTINNDSGNSLEITAVEDIFPTLDGINGETTSSSVLDNDTLDGSPATLAEVSLNAISILDPSSSPTTDIVLNADGSVTVLANTATGDYTLTYKICELAEPNNCSQVTNTISVLGTTPSVIIAVEDFFPTLDGVNGETTSMSVLDNDTLDGLPVTLAEVSLLAVNPISNIILNPDGTITVLPNTSTVDYYLTYQICELADPSNCSLVTDMISVIGPTSSTNDVIVSGDSWNYYDNENEPSGSWKTIGYDDSSWSTGNAVLGFNNGETTTLNSATNTAYFRKTISISNASSITNIDLSAIRDDGMIVYVNDTEVWRDNMPSGSVLYSTQASSFIKGADETTFINQSISNNLVDGNNVVAVEIHVKVPKGKNKVPDMSFDFTMTTTSGGSSRSAVVINDINIKPEKEVKIYPNPSNFELNISFSDKTEKIQNVNIYNLNNRFLLSSKSALIDVDNLKSGVYIIEIISNTTTYHKKVLIKQ